MDSFCWYVYFKPYHDVGSQDGKFVILSIYVLVATYKNKTYGQELEECGKRKIILWIGCGCHIFLFSCHIY